MWNATNLAATAFRATSGSLTPLRWPIVNAAEYVGIPTSPLYDGDVGTWVLWMRTRQGFTGVNVIVMGRHDTSSSSNGASLFLTPTDAFLSCRLRTAAGANRLAITGNVSLDAGNVGTGPDGPQRLVALSFSKLSGAEGSLWLDGKLHASGTNSGAWDFAGQDIKLGYSLDTVTWARYGGAMGFVRWYNRSLSADEHRELYANPFAGFADIWGDLALPTVVPHFNSSFIRNTRRYAHLVTR